MPLGWERINARTSGPNKNIVFIKPLPGPDTNTSKDFLERIAAQCFPIMQKHHLAVVSLEEYEPNLEFWGRNFNNGEVIQLVLKSPSTGLYLPFPFVQGVMMHELAHNKQMNHSKAFWAVRNEFSAEMKALWDRGYTGDGLWGRGVLLENGAFTRKGLDASEVLPEHICGGTFRSKGGKKRRAKPKITYKERQERRIKKKFGSNGTALGADEETKAQLEKGKRPVGKPRVAGSLRGRELRAAAALARFEVKKEEKQMSDDDLVTDSDADSDTNNQTIKTEPDDAIDINGLRLLDSKGGGMVKVCREEDDDDEDVKRELLELQSIPGQAQQYLTSKPAPLTKSTATGPRKPSKPSVAPVRKAMEQALKQASTASTGPFTHVKLEAGDTSAAASEGEKVGGSNPAPGMAPNISGLCPVCSVVNEPTALTCMVCSNVLKPEFVPNTWHCTGSACNPVYINSGDVMICGICATRKSSDGN
ncbi:hypothetical protein EG329_003483 [Mollisiaceae sp. DMI_Dod_QoI]|nr:hypothetical protein EG329_003483 [Helotiales sp. DMI_Dod_QoI]